MPLYARRMLPSTPCQAAVQTPDVFLQRINSILLPVDQRCNSSSEEMMKTEFSEVKNCRNERHCPWGRGCLGVYPPPAARRALPGDHWTADRLGALRHFDASTLRHFDTKKRRRTPSRRQDHPPSVTVIKISVTRDRHGQARRRSPRQARDRCSTCRSSPRPRRAARDKRGQAMWYITHERRRDSHRQTI